MMLTTGLLYLALFALAARMQRHRPLLLDAWQRHPFVAHLALAGWMLLGLSLLSLWLWADVDMALVAWIGLMPLLGGAIMLGMTYRPALPRIGVPVAAAMMVAGLLA
ncbi:DUF3325 family protein [Sphingobium sp. CR2-8]|uniref:DUF3325 family protein n=1 Tax=Sphingobium sp. CR2-8 TaxID=1306534 RepID=UPI002DBCF197|nr:DUF3325 family protein [Sphingobium sp. CR2-8]MEC3909314.1 DUF3325 family protein [Sphingobium sp. CR2-8]